MAGEAGVAPRLLPAALIWLSSSPDLRLPHRISMPRSLLSWFVLTQSLASHLFGINSWILAPVAPLALRALVPTGSTLGSQPSLVRGAFRVKVLEPPVCLCARTRRLATWS